MGPFGYSATTSLLGYWSSQCSQPEKYNDNSEYDVLIGSISSDYTASLVEGLSDELATSSIITTKKRHSKVYAKTLAQRWRIGLGPAQQKLKTTAQVGVKPAVHPLTCQYKTYIIHGYHVKRLNTTI